MAYNSTSLFSQNALAIGKTIPRAISIQFAPRMPDQQDEPIEAISWMVQHLMKDLQEAKMWPIKMANMKHQEKLRNSATFLIAAGCQHQSPSHNPQSFVVSSCLLSGSSLAHAAQLLESTYFELKTVADEIAQAED